MKINYTDADGKIIELEVSDEVGSFFLSSVEAEKKNDRKNSRPDRHTPLYTDLAKLEGKDESAIRHAVNRAKQKLIRFLK